MKKQIIVESPDECPYRQEWKNLRGEIIRYWCSYLGYDECNPDDCPLEDVRE